MVLFRNRLCILSGDTITCSRTGDYFNFWSASALTTADNDPVDLAAGSSSTSSNATLMDAIEIGQVKEEPTSTSESSIYLQETRLVPACHP